MITVKRDENKGQKKISNSYHVKKMFNDFEYALVIIFGPKLEEKLDIAMRGKDIPELETEEEAEKRQKGQGLKVMTPSQLMTKLPILLAQKQAGNN